MEFSSSYVLKSWYLLASPGSEDDAAALWPGPSNPLGCHLGERQLGQVDGWNSNNISLFWIVRRITNVSYLPYICLVSLNVVEEILHSKATKCWSITSWESRHSNKTPDSIFQATGTVKILVSVYLPEVNFLGSTSLPDISEIIMKMVIGVHLIGCYLCELQDRKGSPLTETEVKAAMRGFEESVERGKMSRGISPEMVSIPFEERDCTEEVTQAVIRVAKEAAVSSLESLFQELRQKDQSQY